MQDLKIKNFKIQFRANREPFWKPVPKIVREISRIFRENSRNIFEKSNLEKIICIQNF